MMSERSKMRTVQSLVLVAGLILMQADGSKGKSTAPSFRDAMAHASQNTTTTDTKRSTEKIQFKVVLEGKLVDEDKIHLAITDYLSSDGVGLTVLHNQFSSTAALRNISRKFWQEP
jgi:hypothetical protein